MTKNYGLLEKFWRTIKMNDSNGMENYNFSSKKIFSYQTELNLKMLIFLIYETFLANTFSYQGWECK